MKNLFKRFQSVDKAFRKAIEKKVIKLLKKGDIVFNGNVYLHFVDDNVYTKLRRITPDLSYHFERYTFGEVDDFESGMEELDLSALHEVLLALEEHEFTQEMAQDDLEKTMDKCRNNNC